jgi:hypothetical protein
VSRPFLIADLGDGIINTAIGTHQIHALLGQLGELRGDREKYERDDPETGVPLPPGVDGYRLGRR